MSKTITIQVPPGLVDFKCIDCALTWEQLYEKTQKIPLTHTNFGNKRDPHVLCGSCWSRRKRAKRNSEPQNLDPIKKKKKKKLFTCLSCNLNAKQLEKLALARPYFAERRRLKGESKTVAAQYCLPCRMKIDRENRKNQQQQDSTPTPQSPVWIFE